MAHGDPAPEEIAATAVEAFAAWIGDRAPEAAG
jgi:hypothetical protein